MNSLKVLLVLLVFMLASGGTYLYLGMYNFAADEPHHRVTEKVIDFLRERSIEARAYKLQPPDDLDSASRVIRGAGNYEAMCVHCHLGPGQEDNELRKGLYPRPPNLTRHAHDPKEEFWVIKHGIKMTGMPAWGMAGVDDESIWDMVALLQALPEMDAEKYQAVVAASDGHQHGDHAGHMEVPTADDPLPITNTGQVKPGKMSESELPTDPEATSEHEADGGISHSHSDQPD